MFIVSMDYFTGANEDRITIAHAKATTISEAKEAAKKFADTAASRLESCGDEWGYCYPGYVDEDYLGRVYYLRGGGQYYEVYVERKAD